MKTVKDAKSKIDVGQELRNLGALLEHNNHRIEAIGEQYSGIQKTLDAHSKILESHTEMIGSLMVNVEVIKNNVEFLKGGLKKKVDYDEFLALERRLSLLESKMK
jgi:hypothetical protein